MATLFLSQTLSNFDLWAKQLHEINPSLDLRTWDNHGDLEEINVVLAWNPPIGIFPKLPNLKLVQSLGMGVDHLLNCSDFNKAIPVARIIDPDMKAQMSEYILYGVLRYHRSMHFYNEQQTQSLWKHQKRIVQAKVHVGILGLGELGLAVAETLIKNGYTVSSWSASPKNHANITSFFGDDQLTPFLNSVNVLVCLLPLTSKTRDILNYERLKALPQGAFVINPARGQHIVDEDLIKAINEKHISGALLDVYRQEPLPQSHLFWKTPRLEMTPHIASMSSPKTASEQIVENILHIHKNQPPINLVDMTKEY